MKKTFAVLLCLALLLGMTAALAEVASVIPETSQGTGSSEDITGTWVFESASYGGETVMAEDYDITIAFELRGDGTATGTFDFGSGEEIGEGTWSFSGEAGGMLLIDDGFLLFDIRDGRMIMDDAFGDGITMRFVKAAAEESAVTSGPETGGIDVSAGAFSSTPAVGDIVTFGHYEQDNDASNGQEAIEWIVLDTDGVTATLISRYALDYKPYHTEYEDITWEACTLRKWLNSDFLNAAFTADEQSKLVTTTVTADKNPSFSTDPGSDTQDRVWLLSIPDANQYFASDDAGKCAPTDYAIVQGAYTNSDYMVDGRSTCMWWLRSPGVYQDSAALVNIDGRVNFIGFVVLDVRSAVRPVVRFALS